MSIARSAALSVRFFSRVPLPPPDRRHGCDSARRSKPLPSTRSSQMRSRGESPEQVGGGVSGQDAAPARPIGKALRMARQLRSRLVNGLPGSIHRRVAMDANCRRSATRAQAGLFGCLQPPPTPRHHARPPMPARWALVIAAPGGLTPLVHMTDQASRGGGSAKCR